MWSQLTRMLVWLSRCRYSRGFGVQSPSAYQFIRYVVNEPYPYYKYKVLGAGDDRQMRKLGRFYFRLVNWLQPRTILNFNDAGMRYAQYMHAGCEKTRILTVSEPWEQWNWADLVQGASLAEVDLIRLSPSGYVYPSFVQKVLPVIGEHVVVVLEGIHRDSSTLTFWKCVQQDERVGVTYDLYDCGIVFFDKSRFKQHYIVNF